jgi:hypothetical protein
MSPGAPLFGAIVQSSRAAGMGASPWSSTPFESSVCEGRCGSNGPRVGFVNPCHTRENSPIPKSRRGPGGVLPQSSTASKNVVKGKSGHADWPPWPSMKNPSPYGFSALVPAGENSSWMSQRIAGFGSSGSRNVAITVASAAQSFGIVSESPSPSSP